MSIIRVLKFIIIGVIAGIAGNALYNEQYDIVMVCLVCFGLMLLVEAAKYFINRYIDTQQRVHNILNRSDTDALRSDWQESMT